MKKLPLWILLISLFTFPALRADGPDEEIEEEMEWMEEMEEVVMDYLKDVEPRAVKRLQELEENEEEEYWEVLIELAEALEEVEELEQEEPEYAALYERILQGEIKIETLGDAIRNEDSEPEREKLRAELKALLPVAFEDRLNETRMELEFLQREVEEVKAEWERLNTNKEKIIERRYNEVTGADDDLEW